MKGNIEVEKEINRKSITIYTQRNIVKRIGERNNTTRLLITFLATVSKSCFKKLKYVSLCYKHTFM